MRALFLTWEFPPFISGGLGMACYGLAKALLSLGVEIDMVLPTREDVYFPLRKKEDVDLLPMETLSTETPSRSVFSQGSLEERLKSVGLSSVPQSYLTPGNDFKEVLEWIFSDRGHTQMREIEILRTYIMGDEGLFKEVRRYTSRLLKHASMLSCDLIHVHDWLTYPAGILLKRILKKPLVTHMHATEFDRAGGVGDHRIHNIEYAGLSASDRVIAVSQYTAQMVIDRYQINPNKVRVIHNAYSLSSQIMQQRYRLFKDPLILFLGRVTLQKGPDYFLEIAQRVLGRHPKARFIMAGSGDMFSRILKGAAAKRLRDKFLFTGFLNREQVEQILLATDIYLLTSVSEPFGIAPLEAMAFGSAAILSKQSGVSEIIQNAYKIDFWDVEKTADIIIHLLDNPAEREAMALAGQNEVLAIKWKKGAGLTKRVYEEALCST